MTALDLPRTVADISPAWLSDRLAQTFPGITVAAVTPQALHEGTASTYRLNLSYDRTGHDWPETMCIKSDMGLAHADRLAQVGLYRKEAVVYRDILPGTTARTPLCYAADCDEAGRGFMLLQDIFAAGGQFCAPTELLTVEQVKTGVEQLARLHAATWRKPVLAEPQWRHHGVPAGEIDPFWEAQFDAYAASMEETHCRAAAVQFHDGERMRAAFNRLRALYPAATAPSLIHGDAHVGNFFVNSEGAMGMADFQCVQHGHFTHDLASLIGCALDPVARRASDHALIQHYADTMATLVDDAPSFDETWLGYRRHMLYPMIVWMFTTRGYQAEPYLITNVFRTGVACLDLDTLEALGV